MGPGCKPVVRHGVYPVLVFPARMRNPNEEEGWTWYDNSAINADRQAALILLSTLSTVAAPAAAPLDNSEPFGVGAFLLAGSEIGKVGLGNI